MPCPGSPAYRTLVTQSTPIRSATSAAYLGLYELCSFYTTTGHDALEQDGGPIPQALWYFEDECIAVPQAGLQVAGFARDLSATEDVARWASQNRDRHARGTPFAGLAGGAANDPRRASRARRHAHRERRQGLVVRHRSPDPSQSILLRCKLDCVPRAPGACGQRHLRRRNVRCPHPLARGLQARRSCPLPGDRGDSRGHPGAGARGARGRRAERLRSDDAVGA